MNKLSIAQRFTLITVLITMFMLIIGYFVLEHYKTNLEKKVYTNVQDELKSLSKLKIKGKFEVGISNAISISNDSSIQNALESNNRQIAINALSSLSKKMKNSTPFKNIKVHIHTKDSHSFLRSWKPNKFGDDLNSFRHSVVKVNKTKNAINTLEVGKAGLSIRSVVPIIKDGVHLGSLEFMQGINSVAKSFDKQGNSFILLMDKSLAVAKVDDSMILDKYIISQKFINKDFLNDSKTIDFSKLIENKYLISNNYFYTYTNIEDFNGKKLGIALIAEPIEKVNHTIEEASFIIWVALIILVIALIVTMIASLFNMKKNILAPLSNLKSSIDKIKENKELDNTRIKTNSNDEIAELVNSFNSYLDSIEEGLKKDKEVIYEAKDIIEKVNKGLLNSTITKKANSNEVGLLVEEINNMIKRLHNITSELANVLVEMSGANYKVEIKDLGGLTGNIASLFSGLKVTNTTINEMLCLIDNSNIELNQSARKLSNAAKNLSNSSNQQAASLEETAAAIEEISSTISTSTQNANKMSEYAQNVTNSNEKGKNLAFKTSDSMEQLSKEVEAINEAIEVIDQIAFQTNILSLNAAVEAATAGEAGKGFAVVAQEVRNLASRSAEAAKDIKALVESATIKAKDGKEITTEMINGYNELNENITTTIDLIGEVTNASIEQQRAITQINDTVNSLDQATQENAQLANEISQMSNKTSQLAHELQNAIEQTTFDENAKNRVCDTNLIISINKLKSDHISFKNTNFAKCKEGSFFKVKTHHECNLGKWIDANEHQDFAKTKEWDELKSAHEKVHKSVQGTIDLYANKTENSLIFKQTQDVEANIDIVFNKLNEIRVKNCNK